MSKTGGLADKFFGSGGQGGDDPDKNRRVPKDEVPKVHYMDRDSFQKEMGKMVLEKEKLDSEVATIRDTAVIRKSERRQASVDRAVTSGFRTFIS